MASVPLNETRSSGLVTVGAAIKAALNEIAIQSGMDFYDYVNRSDVDEEIYEKLIDQTLFFNQKEYNNENSTTYIVEGISVKEVLSRIATYMGWVVREQGRTIYFERLMDDSDSNTNITYATFGTDTIRGEYVSMEDKNIADLEWMGIDHKRNVRQGAKSVEVVAKLENSKVNAGIPDFPPGDVVVNSKQLYLLNTATQRYLYAIISKNYLAYDSIQFRFFKGTSAYQNYNNEPTTDCYDGVSTFNEAFPTIFLNNPGRDLYTLPRYAGAFYIQIANEEEETDDPQYSNGIYLSFIPGLRIGTTVALNTAPIFKYTTPLSYSFQQGGTFKLEINAFEMMGSFGQQGTQQGISSSVSVLAHLRIGNNYWNGSGWVQSPTVFELSFESETTISSVLAERMEGQIELAFYPHGVMSKLGTPIGPHQQIVYRWYLYDEVVISKLDMSYEVEEDPNLTNRSENHYFRLLGTNFRDEISVNTDLASNLNNQPSPSILFDRPNQPMETMRYQGIGRLRPEVDLLNRLDTYYGASRQTLDIIIKHPMVGSTPQTMEGARLPILRLHGIGDNKKYLPLAESRDWRTDVCTLTCFETPQ